MEGVAVAVPVFPQLTVEDAPAVIPPLETVVDAVEVQPPLIAVTVTVYVPEARLVIVCVVPPFDQLYVTPVAGVAVAVPLLPEQLFVDAAPAVMLPLATVVEAVDVQPPEELVTVTV